MWCEDIEFLQHCGGMNPGEKFYKQNPHLKPEKRIAGYTKVLTPQGYIEAPIYEKEPEYKKLTADDEIVILRVVPNEGADLTKYFVKDPDAMNKFLDGVAQKLQNKKPIKRGIPWKNTFRKKSQ